MAILTNIGKKLIGERAGAYLPFALSKLRYFASTNPPTPFSRTIGSDDAIITLELHSPTTGSVTIIASGFNYEFTTPGDKYMAGSFGGIATVRGYAVKVKFNPNKETAEDKFVAIAKGSNAEASPTQEWQYSEDIRALAKFAPHKQIWQIQHIPAHVYYASIKNKLVPTGPRKLDASVTLANSWSSSCEITNLNIHSRSGTVGFNYDAGVPQVTKSLPLFDDIFDIGPTFFEGSDIPKKGRGIVPDSDWYKRSAYCVAEHPVFGKRAFIIMTDITNKFYAYPLGTLDLTLSQGSPFEDQLIKTNLPAQYVKSQDAPFPDWVRKPPSGQLARDWYKANPPSGEPSVEVWRRKYASKFPQYRWSFNSTATRAVTVAFFDYEEIIGKDQVNEPPPPTPNDFANIGQKVGLGPKNGFQYDIKEAIPGLVELKIQISITGPNAEDFDFGLSLGSQINPDTDKRYIVAADYSWGPKPGKPSYGADLDDLVIMEFDVYPCGTTYPVPSPVIPDRFPFIPTINEKALIYVKNVTQDETLKTFTQSRVTFYEGDPNSDTLEGFYSEYYKLRFLAYDLRVMGFMTESTYLRGEIQTDNSNRQGDRSAKKVNVSIYGEDEPPLYFGAYAGMNAYMETYAADVNVSDMLRLEPSLKADLWEHTVVGGLWKYTYGTDPLSRCLLWRFAGSPTQPGEMYLNYHLSESPDIVRTNTLPRSDYRLGASRYSTLMDDTFRCGLHSAFSVHPEGHWALTSPVIIHYAGQIRSIGGGNVSPIETGSVKQDYVDIVSVNMQKKDGTFEEVRTTHVALFNKAYKKNVNKNSRYWIAAVLPDRLRMYHPYDLTKYFDFRHNTSLSYNATFPVLDPQHSYMIRGSSMYFGRLHKETKE